MFPLVRVECLLCGKHFFSCLRPVLRHGAEHGTRVEEVVLQAFALFIVLLCFPVSSEGCVREYQLRVSLIDIVLVLSRHLLVVRLLLLVDLARADEG